MFNLLLDRLPTEYMGYLIRTDYRIGIQILQALDDVDLSDEDRTLNALYLLYGNGIPDDVSVALNGLRWFLSCGSWGSSDLSADLESVDEERDRLVSSNDEVAFDFDIDSAMIYSAMYSQYGVEIDKERIHWFKFMSMFKSLKDTQLNDIMYYRTVDISKLPKYEQSDMRKLKEAYRIRKVTAERKEELIACFGDDWRRHI